MKVEEAVALIGTKYYKITGEDSYQMIRLASVNQKKSQKDNCVFNAFDVETNESMEIYEKALNSWWTKLIPDGLITFMRVGMKNGDSMYDDVIVATYKADTIANDIQKPDVICRQNIIDFQYQEMTGTMDNDMVGACISSTDDYGPEIYQEILYINQVYNMIGINIYINDTMDDILKLVGDTSVFDKSLEAGFKSYINKISGIDMGQQHTKGHCRDLRTLLEVNNYFYSQDSIFHIVPMKINIEDNLEHVVDDNSLEYDELNKKLKEEFSYLFRKNITKAIAVEFDHSIDLSKIPSDRFLLVRGQNGKLWIIRITYEGEFLESEMDRLALQSYLEDIDIVAKYGTKNKSKK